MVEVASEIYDVIVTTGLGPANGNRKRRDSNNVIEQI